MCVRKIVMRLSRPLIKRKERLSVNNVPVSDVVIITYRYTRKHDDFQLSHSERNSVHFDNCQFDPFQWVRHKERLNRGASVCWHYYLHSLAPASNRSALPVRDDHHLDVRLSCFRNDHGAQFILVLALSHLLGRVSPRAAFCIGRAGLFLNDKGRAA